MREERWAILAAPDQRGSHATAGRRSNEGGRAPNQASAHRQTRRGLTTRCLTSIGKRPAIAEIREEARRRFRQAQLNKARARAAEQQPTDRAAHLGKTDHPRRCPGTRSSARSICDTEFTDTTPPINPSRYRFFFLARRHLSSPINAGTSNRRRSPQPAGQRPDRLEARPAAAPT